jgi:anti-sigma B factor antagonist
MNIEITGIGDAVTCVKLSGRLDASGAESVGPRLTAVVAEGRPAVVDLRGVDYIASSGMRLLLAGSKNLKLKGARLVVFGAQQLVMDVLEQSALDEVIDVEADEAGALQRAKRG